MDFYLGIDTSNYTTSLAAVRADGGEIYSVRKLLATPDKQVGLRQSDAHFLHTQNLPELAMSLREKMGKDARIVSVGVSTRPRSVEGSYMPCFLAGVAAAHTAAMAAGATLFETSHQEGHIAAALYGCPDFPVEQPFYSLHLSGGTMELLRVLPRPAGFETSLAAATLDVTAGQLIDRVGVAMGLSFPCGKAMDELALCGKRKFTPGRISLKETGINLSGLENRAKAYLQAGESKEDVSFFLFSELARAILALYESGAEALPLLLCGGVSSSTFLKNALKKDAFYFTDPALATDNAVGVALLAREKGELA